MKRTVSQRQANVSKSDDKAASHSERAMRDGAWRGRPLWRSASRPDSEWGPRLTLAARLLLHEENRHADDHRR